MGNLWALNGHIAQSQEGIFDRVHSDQKVLQVIRRGRVVLVIRGQESKASSRDNQARVHSDQIVFMMARWEAGPRKQRLNSKATLSQLKPKEFKMLR